MSQPLEIRVGATPNPNAMKFTLNRTVTTQGTTYRAGASADAPWAQLLLSIAGIAGVFAINNFISINKTPESDWNEIVPKAEAALRRAFQ